MACRQDTRDRILMEACSLFAENGYDAARVQDVCTRAGANVASVNYYFRSKENLYKECWAASLKMAEEAYGMAACASELPPREWVYAWVEAGVRSAFDDGPGSLFRRIVHREMASPTPFSEELKERFLLPRLRWLAEAVSKLMGISPDRIEVLSTVVSIQSQVIHIGVSEGPRRILFGRDAAPSDEQIDILVRQMTCFVLGGVAAVKGALSAEGEE